MIRINLLPFRSARKKENVRHHLSIFFLSLILCAIAIFAYYLKLNSDIDDLNESIKVAKAELEKYEKINREIEEIKRKLDNLNKKLAIIRELEASRYEPTRLMDTLSQVVVEKRMWFNSLDVKADSISINGTAMDDKTVADFMVRLEGSGLFSAVILRSVRQVEVQRTNLKSFDITCQKKPFSKAETKTK